MLTVRVFFFFIFLSVPAYAGVSALGFEIGTADFEQVRTALTEQGNVEHAGINKYSGGPMLLAPGSLFQIEGLNSALFIFDENAKLAGILMKMGKYKFNDIFGHLSSKYKLISKQIPFVGDSSAKFQQDDVHIEVDAPHLSFEMTVLYMKKTLLSKINSESSQEKKEQKAKEKSMF